MVLRVRGLRKSYSGLEVLRGIDMAVAKGETVAIMGPSGCGKSTLLRCITRITEPDEGEIWFKDRLLTELDDRDLRMVRRKIGFVFQGHNLIGRMTAVENVALGLIVSGVGAQEAYDLSMEALDRVGLGKKGDALPNELSGGERQRVGIARTLVMQPDLILWDEPTASLDPVLVGEIYLLIQELAEKDQTAMVIITHEVPFALGISDRLLLMEHGMVVEEGIPSKVLSSPSSQVGYTLSKAIRFREQNWYSRGAKRYVFPGKYFAPSGKTNANSVKVMSRLPRSSTV